MQSLKDRSQKTKSKIHQENVAVTDNCSIGAQIGDTFYGGRGGGGADNSHI